jgi:hypothetical protein
MRRLFCFVSVVLALSASAVAAQSLGDVARQEEARRKTAAPAGKVYTNDSLRPDASAPATSPTTPAATPAAETPAAASPAPAATQSADTPKKDETYWRGRVARERDALGRSQTFAEALQSRINALTADFANRDDPYQRNQIGTDRQKALAELDRVRKEISDHTKALSDIQEEARKAGVPAGWVR